MGDFIAGGFVAGGFCRGGYVGNSKMTDHRNSET